MRTSITILIVLTLSIMASDAHQYPRAYPEMYHFVFQNGDSINVSNENDSLLKSISSDIVRHKRILLEARLNFNTGEEVVFEYASGDLISIFIKYENDEAVVSKEVVDKIPEVHFSSVLIKWAEPSDLSAFTSKFLRLELNIGIVKWYDYYPNLSLRFENKEFSKSSVTMAVAENTFQSSAYMVDEKD